MVKTSLMNSRVLFVIAIASLVACSHAKEEARALVGAVDAYRMADNAHKGSAASAIETIDCTDAEVCAAKDACLKSARPTAKGLAIKDQVAKKFDDLEARRIAADADIAQTLPGQLDEASRLMAEGHDALAVCDQRVTALRMKHGI
jgi:hypothetical protein